MVQICVESLNINSRVLLAIKIVGCPQIRASNTKFRLVHDLLKTRIKQWHASATLCYFGQNFSDLRLNEKFDWATNGSKFVTIFPSKSLFDLKSAVFSNADYGQVTKFFNNLSNKLLNATQLALVWSVGPKKAFLLYPI